MIGSSLSRFRLVLRKEITHWFSHDAVFLNNAWETLLLYENRLEFFKIVDISCFKSLKNVLADVSLNSSVNSLQSV